jgi:CheY-like chemotaxis protein
MTAEIDSRALSVDSRAKGPRLVESYPVDAGPPESLIVAHTILLVEDETFVREVTREVLQSAGYRVLAAGTGTEAIATYENDGNVDLLITDVVLPGETGLALAARLQVENPQLIVLFVTGYIERMKIGEENCLAKPFSSEALLRTIRRLLSDRNSVKNSFSGVPAAASGLHDLRGNL